MKYRLIGASSYADLTLDVNDAIEEGWELYGNPFIGRDDWCYQAVIKREATPND